MLEKEVMKEEKNRLMKELEKVYFIYWILLLIRVEESKLNMIYNSLWVEESQVNMIFNSL